MHFSKFILELAIHTLASTSKIAALISVQVNKTKIKEMTDLLVIIGQQIIIESFSVWICS